MTVITEVHECTLYVFNHVNCCSNILEWNKWHPRLFGGINTKEFPSCMMLFWFIVQSTADKGELLVALCYNNHLERLTVGVLEARDLKYENQPSGKSATSCWLFTRASLKTRYLLRIWSKSLSLLADSPGFTVIHSLNSFIICNTNNFITMKILNKGKNERYFQKTTGH